MITDLEALKVRVGHHLSEAHALPVRVRDIKALAGGACQDNLKVEVEIGTGPERQDEILVLRSDAVRLLSGSLDRRLELEVIRAAVTGGVPTPRARWLGKDLVRPGAYAYFLDWAPGVAIGRKVLTQPDLAAARGRLPVALAGALAKIHDITPHTHPALSSALGQNVAQRTDSASGALSSIRAQIDQLVEPHLGLELAFSWLLDARPTPAEQVLVHGDFRTGNFLVTPEGLSAILDWEFAHFGSFAEDLAWISVRDWRFGNLDRPIGGFAQRAPFYEAYEAASGRTVDRHEVHFYEVLGNLRWATGSLLQSERYLSGAERDLELIAIGRRAAEMQYEALRLIERGP